MYDSRLGRQLSLDPLMAEYPWQTPYAYHRNSPIAMIDYLGMGDKEDWYENKSTGEVTWRENDKSESLVTVDDNGNKQVLINVGEELSDSYIKSKGGDLKHIKEIKDGQYRYTQNYGWLDMGHIGGKAHSDPTVSAANLWYYINNEKSNTTSYSSNDEFYFLEYNQKQYIFGLNFYFGNTYKINKGLSAKEKRAVALNIMIEVAIIFEGAQALISNSGFSPEDIPSDVLGLYISMYGLDKNQVDGIVKPFSMEKSMEMLMNNPTTFTSSKYKNKTRIPLLFGKDQSYSEFLKLDSKIFIPDAFGKYQRVPFVFAP